MVCRRLFGKEPAMPKKLALFSHKGGVGKTTLTINLADALADLGKTVLLVDADPQCNLSAFYLEEKLIDALLGESAETESGNTISGPAGRAGTSDGPGRRPTMAFKVALPAQSITGEESICAD